LENKAKIDYAVNHLFRQESGKMVSVLVKIFGAENYEMAEDVVQDALLSALETWKFRGMPDNPRAWLYRVAKNKAIDIIRRNKYNPILDFSDPARKLLASEYTLTTTMDNYWKDDNIKDDFLGMMYACCIPELSEENQITFMLKALCGFSTKEIAKSFLTSEDAISKRLYRTKQHFRENKVKLEIPSHQEVKSRTKAVLNTIYLLFNEGYNATHAENLIREDLISQAMLLCKSLIENEKTRLPETYALMALMCFHSSRNPGRLTSIGDIIPLSKQDRSLWNWEWIHLGNEYLNKAAYGESLTYFHLEAAISFEHCIAKDYMSTSWRAILGYYDAMLKIHYDPVVFLNRSIALMEAAGPQEALNSLNKLKNNRQIMGYYLYHAVLGELFSRLGQRKEAFSSYQKARNLTLSRHEKRFLTDKLSLMWE
jgi:RNA polymerase sigma factor (sigma-70 family)